MNQQTYTDAHRHIVEVLGISPMVLEILQEADDVADARGKLEIALLTNLARKSDPDLPSPLEWVLRKDATHVLLNLLLPRNEDVAGFSLLNYLMALVRGRWDADCEDLPAPAPGFLAEIEHLLRGVTGTTDVYDEKRGDHTPVAEADFSSLRSDELNHIAALAQERATAVPCGLDRDVIRRRSRNRTRILEYFDATDLEWNDWQWQVRNTIRDAGTLKKLIELTPSELEAVEKASDNSLPFAITPYYASLMDFRANSEADAAVRAQVIPSLSYVTMTLEEMQEGRGCMDFMLERDTSPIEGVTRRYPMICILKPVLTCPQICVYCQRNWQITNPDVGEGILSEEKLEAAIEWISSNKEIQEVLVTGGDPFILSNRKLHWILSRLSRIKHVHRIRIGTRTPVTVPQRITEALIRNIAQYHVAGQREVVIVTHFEHPYEITPEAMEAVQRIRRHGMSVYNQTVFTYYNSHRFEACALRDNLRLIGVTPYYTFNTKGKEETADFRVPIARLLQEQKEEQRLFPGTVRTDEVVFNVPRLGKNYLRAGQHHDIIAIRPDGRRMYEFHPWEKKLSPVGTYVYTDVSIHGYLERLEKDGEPVDEYRTIWYYY